MNKYKEILRLKGMLEKAKIPFEFSKFWGVLGYLTAENVFHRIEKH